MRPRVVLVGRDRGLTLRAVAAAVALAGLAGGLVWAVAQAPTADLPAPRPATLRWLLLGGIALGGLGAAAVAHLNDGIVPTLALATAAPLGFYAALGTAGLLPPGGSFAQSLGTAAGVGVGVGTPAFLAGVVVRRFRE
jgi:hypothetical protein